MGGNALNAVEINPVRVSAKENVSKFEIKVTRIKSKYHARLFRHGKLVDEMSCQLRVDIGYICRTMLRWQDKCGEGDAYSRSARRRLNAEPGPKGLIEYEFSKISKSS